MTASSRRSCTSARATGSSPSQDVPYGAPEEITVQVEEFNNLTDPTATTVLVSNGGDTLELNLYDLQRLKHLLLLAEDDLIKAMDEQEARNA